VKLTSYNWLKEEKYITDFNISKVAIAKKRLSNINQVTWLQKLIKCLVYKESILVQHKLSVYKQGNMFVDDMYKKNPYHSQALHFQQNTSTQSCREGR